MNRLIHMPHSSQALTTAQLAFPQSAQGLSPQAPGVGTQGVVPQPGRTAAKEARDPAQPAVTRQVVRVEVPGERRSDGHSSWEIRELLLFTLTGSDTAANSRINISYLYMTKENT